MPNPILDEIDQARRRLSPPAQDALMRSGALTMDRAPLSDAEMAAPGPLASAMQPMAAPAPDPIRGPLQPPSAPMPRLAAPQSSEEQANRAELTRLTAPPQPGMEHTRANTGASGIDQIENPWARVPLQIADALGSAMFPRVMPGLPGTRAHHNLLVDVARENVTQDLGERKAGAQEEQTLTAAAGEQATIPLREAQTEEARAHAESLRNPKPATSTPHTITTDKGIMQYNPQTQRFDIPVGQAPARETAVTPQKSVFTDEEGNTWVIDELEGTATPVMGAPSGAPPETIETTDGPVESTPAAAKQLKGKKPAEAGATPDMREYEFAVARGETKKGFTDWLKDRANDRRPVTQVINPAGEYNTKQLQALTRLNNDVSRNPTYARAASMKSFAANLLTALGRGDGVSDVAAINQFQKLIDEGAVTRDADVRLIQSANDLAGRLNLMVDRLRTGAQLTPQHREQIRNLTNAMVADQQRAVSSDPYIKAKIAEAKQFGIDPTDTILSEVSGGGAVPSGGTGGGVPRVGETFNGQRVTKVVKK